MIARVWRAQATHEGSEAYRHHFAASVRPVLEGLAGHRGSLLLRREGEGGSCEYLVVTLWDSMDAVRAFAGPDSDRALVEPAARAVLSEFEPFVRHYEAIIATACLGEQ